MATKPSSLAPPEAVSERLTAPIYPGSNAKVGHVVKLADEYFSAAHRLLPQCDPENGPEASAPARLCAIHAIELYLNAFLRFNDFDGKQVRGFQHDLAKRLEMASELKLDLKGKTRDHILNLHEQRDYLVVRYGPEQLDDLAQLNRMFATLKEVAEKVRHRIYNQPFDVSDPRFKKYW